MSELIISAEDILKCKNNYTFYILKDKNNNVVKAISINPIDKFSDLISKNYTGIKFVKNSHICFEISRIKKIINGEEYYVEVYNDITKTTKVHDKDQLTGLYNRSRIDREIEIINNEDVIVILGDVDNFKEINDTYGHLAGDEILQFISRAFKDSIRKSDFIGRFGGDEFILFLHDISIKRAKQKMEKIRKQIIKKPYVYIDPDGDKSIINITVTFGLYEHEPNTSYEETLSKADQALYYAKECGKNSSYIYEEKKD